MQCKSCNEEIPAKFKHSITVNICPFCGEEIIPPELQIALSELKDLMQTSTELYKSEVFEWLRSNYNLISTDSDEYKKLEELATSPYKNKRVDPRNVKLDANGNQIGGEPMQQQGGMTTFMARAMGNKMPTNQEHFKDIVRQIKKGTGATVSMGADVEVDESKVAEMQAAIEAESSIRSSIATEDYSNDVIPPVVEMMARQAGTGGGSSKYNAKDVAMLQRMQEKSRGASEELDFGGSVGLIKRV